MLHVVDFRTPAGDTGEPNSDSIEPYNNGESADQVVFRRPAEHTRLRTESLRQLVREHILLKDYNDADAILSGGGTLTVSAGGTGLTFTMTSDLYVLPYGTPGGNVSVPYVASTKATLSIGAGVNELVFTSVQKQFEGSTFPEADANKISVEILDAGVGQPITVTVEGAAAEANNIKITLDASVHTLNQVIAAVAAHATAPNFVVASLGSTAVGTSLCPLFGPPEWSGDYTARFLRGGAPGVAHQITPAGLIAFFGTAANELKLGDTLAVYYDKVLNTTTTGGRVQSTPENTNLLVNGALFNTRVEPEKIPNSIPICKRVEGNELHFTNGAIVVQGTPATLKVDSYALISAETGLLSTPLGWDRMGTGTDHNPPVTIRDALDNADGHIHNILNEIEAARTSALTGAQASLVNRLEADMDHIGRTVVTVSDGTASTGGLYNGTTALEDAITAHGSGVTYLVRKGSYTITTNFSFGERTNIIAQDAGPADITVTFSHGAGYAFAFGAGAHGSRVEGLGMTGTNKDFMSFTSTAHGCIVRGCDSDGRFYVALDAGGLQITGCKFTHATVASNNILFVSGTGCLIGECGFEVSVSAPAIDYSAVSAAPWSLKIRNCFADVQVGGNQFLYSNTNANNLSVENLAVFCDATTTTATPMVQVSGRKHSFKNVSYLLYGAGSIKQQLFYMEGSGTVDVVELNLNGATLGYTAVGRNPFKVKALESGSIVVTALTVHDFAFPPDNVIDLDAPAIVGVPSTARSRVVFDAFSAYGMSDGAGLVTNYSGRLLGSEASSGVPVGAGPLTIRGANIDTTGLSWSGNAADDYVMILNLPQNSTVEDCMIFGSGVCYGIRARGAQDYVIRNNRIFAPADNCGYQIQVLPAGANVPNGCIVDGNTIYHWANRSNFSSIVVIGQNAGNPTERPRVTNNSVLKSGGGAWAGSSISFNDVNKGTVFHNNVDSGIAYGAVTGMLPLAGSLGTYNILA